MVIRRLFEILALIVITEGCCFATDPEINEEIEVNLGDNITLTCHNEESTLSKLETISVMWVRDGRDQGARLKIQEDGSLRLTDINKNDSGIYTCSLDEDTTIIDKDTVSTDGSKEIVKAKYDIHVRSPPGPLTNVTVLPSSILALLLWEVGDTGGYDVTHFTAQYRMLHIEPPDEWHFVKPHKINPTVRSIDIYHLKPNSTYAFQIWANNKLGEGDITEVEGTTLHDDIEIELARHLLDGAENFDTRVWVAAVAIVMGTLLLLAAGTCYLLYKECNLPSFTGDDQEIIELVPNIILNPGFYEAELSEPDENSNDRAPIHITNTHMRPIRV